MPILRRQIRRDSRQSTRRRSARTARRGSLDDSRILTFIDLSGNVVGVVTQPGSRHALHRAEDPRSARHSSRFLRIEP
jgi:hypothetical protein